VKTLLTQFFRDEQGQDLIEYTLLLAFMCLARSPQDEGPALL